MKALKSVILTLQYCLETFEQTCQCGRCDPCRQGQDDIKQAIRTIENLLQPG
jgi:NADH:ubiquinone oxidoreductase subunit F (NADH-binding)